LNYERAERRLIRLAVFSRTVNETEQVAQLLLSLTRACCGLMAFGVAKTAERSSRREDAWRQEQEPRRSPSGLDGRLIEDLIRRSRQDSNHNAPVEEAQVIND